MKNVEVVPSVERRHQENIPIKEVARPLTARQELGSTAWKRWAGTRAKTQGGQQARTQREDQDSCPRS